MGSSDALELIEVTIPGGKVVFTTRRGGVSGGIWEALNLGVECGDRPQDVVENRRLLAETIGLDPDRFRISRQVHGGRIQQHGDPVGEGSFLAPESGLEEADGHFTDTLELPLVVTVADCAPVFVTGKGGVALLHCGWRGLLTDLIERACLATGGDRAVIGPCIGPCCFAVGQDVRDLFGVEGEEDPGTLDLRSIITTKLREGGVGSVHTVNRCTSCESEHFFSYRRDRGSTGRQAAVGWRTAE